jgi:hypothetical protein
MRLALQILSYMAIVVGAFAIIGGFTPTANGTLDPYAFIGGGLFFVQGLLTVIYLQRETE